MSPPPSNRRFDLKKESRELLVDLVQTLHTMFKLLSAQTTKLFVRKKRQKRAKKRTAKKGTAGIETGTQAEAAEANESSNATGSNQPEALEDVSHERPGLTSFEGR